MRYLGHVLATVGLLIGPLPPASAVLLGVLTSEGGAAGNGTSRVDDYRNMQEVALLLGYHLPASAIPRPLGVCIGCDQRIPVENVLPGATFVFDSSNSDDFAEFESLLTNGVPEMLWSLAYVYDSDPDWVGGGGGGRFDSVRFPTASSWQLDFIRVTVVEYSLTANPVFCAECPGPGFDFSILASWEFWGTGIPAMPVPEPSTLALFALGAAGMAWVRRARKGSAAYH